MSYKDNYKSIQVNLLKNKHKDLIEWLDKLCDEQERSLNSVIIHILKMERNKWVENLQSKKQRK